MAVFIGPEMLTRLIAEKADMPLGDAQKVAKAYEDVVVALLEAGARVRLFGLGHMEIVTTKPSTRRSIFKEGIIQVSARKKVVFKEAHRKK